jgi:hypothetical protein
MKHWIPPVATGIKVISLLGIVVLLGMFVNYRLRRLDEITSTRQSTACPSLLSIGHSSRDTLIIMRSEPLCNQYVMDNLK